MRLTLNSLGFGLFGTSTYQWVRGVAELINGYFKTYNCCLPKLPPIDVLLILPATGVFSKELLQKKCSV